MRGDAMTAENLKDLYRFNKSWELVTKERR